MTTSTISTTLGRLPIVVTWCVMIIPALVHRLIGHSNPQFSSLLSMHLGSSILVTSRRWVTVCVLLSTVLHIVTRFTTSVTVYGEYNLLRISTSTTPSAHTTVVLTVPSTPATMWRCSSLGVSGHGGSHSSGDSLKHHSMKRHRISWEGILISIGESHFGSQFSRPRSRGPVFSIRKLLVIGSSRPNYFLKVQTICLRDQGQ